MTKEYINGVLRYTKEDGSYVELSNNPLTLKEWTSEDEAFAYNFDVNKFKFMTDEERRLLLVPDVVSMRQARLALLEANLLTTVETAIVNGIDEALKIEWEYATEVRRDWESLNALATSLGLTDLDLDNLFTSAQYL